MINIAIIGGSITGCACSILLNRFSHLKVRTFERRAPEQLKGQGYGLAFPSDLLTNMKKIGIVDQDISPSYIKHREHYYTDKNTNTEQLIFNTTSNISTLNWEILYRQLASRTKVSYNHNLVALEEVDDKIHLSFDNNSQYICDFVIFCDGIHSLGRELISPCTKPIPSNYAAWRGKITLDPCDTTERLIDKQLLYMYRKGLGFFYFIPSLDKTKYTINALLYEKNINEPTKSGTINEAVLSKKNSLEKYKKLLLDLPPFARTLFNMVPEPFFQPIQSIIAEKFFYNNIILAGDAACTLEPITGSGASKGINDAIALAQIFSLSGTKEIKHQLNLWSNDKRMKMNNLAQLGYRLSDFYVMDPPHWETSSPETIQNLWNTITAPYEWYIKKDNSN
jgi:salicylate hydroxylase